MKKLLKKDKKRRFIIKKLEKKFFILNSIFKNLNFFNLLRWNAFLKLKTLSHKSSKISLSNRCLYTINRKRFNKLTTFSRQVFLKLIRAGQISNIQKVSW
jgi:ribosomal protein S14